MAITEIGADSAHLNRAPTTRRAVLGALAAIPAVAIATPALASVEPLPVDRSAWDRALAAFRAAEAAMNANNDDDLADDLGGAYCDAAGALIETPAPDHAALHWKLDYLFGDAARSEEDDRTSPAWCNAYVVAVMADADRLLAA